MKTTLTTVWTLVALWAVAPAISHSAEATVSLADGKVTMNAPESWEKKTPRTRIVDFEFAAPTAEGDDTAARVTVMGAGGSVEANIDRWIGQFSQPDGRSTKDRTKTEKFEVSGSTVHVVDISGRFKDQPGPFAPAVYRDEYRMIGAIVVTDKLGQYFIKMYGPKATVEKNAKAFREMLDSLKVAKAAE
ncbi:MAG: hypothetical protein KDA47_11060 [Planctomycetales bacterium]|nr:hypothetical protein [Planctomycetales bacterium]